MNSSNFILKTCNPLGTVVFEKTGLQPLAIFRCNVAKKNQENLLLPRICPHLHVSSAQNPSIIPSYWFVEIGISRSWIMIIPNI